MAEPSKAEARRIAEDAVTQERAAARPYDIGQASPGYIRATHPDHGQTVTFVPGELLPDWAAELYRAGKGAPDELGVLVLPPVSTSKGKR